MRRIRRTSYGGNLRYIRRVLEFSDNLVAYYPGNVKSGTTLYNKAPLTDNDGTLTGVELGVQGIGDGLSALGFDGSTSYADISAIASNLIANGGFETAGGGGADVHASWTENAGDGAIDNETITVHTGSDALKLTAGASTDTYDDQTVTVVAGSTNKIRLWVYGDGSDPARYSIYDVSNSASIQALTSIGSTATSWTMVDIEFDAPAGCTSVRLRLQCPDANGGIAYFDTVSLRRVDVPTFDPHEGTVVLAAQADSASVWTDNAEGILSRLRTDTGNYMDIRKGSGNELAWRYVANGVLQADSTIVTPTDVFFAGMTWSLSGDKASYYYNGGNSGGDLADDSGLGTWVGQLGSTSTAIGAANTTPIAVWNGMEAHALIANRAFTADEMAYLMRGV